LNFIFFSQMLYLVSRKGERMEEAYDASCDGA
jgi:hypothetical protein